MKSRFTPHLLIHMTCMQNEVNLSNSKSAAVSYAVARKGFDSVSYGRDGDEQAKGNEDLKDIWKVCTHFLSCKLFGSRYSS